MLSGKEKTMPRKQSKVKQFFSKVGNFLKRFWKKGKNYIKKGGLNLVIALVIWLSPTWLAFFIPALKDFAVVWLGLVISPVVPSWLAVPLLAVIVALIRKGIVILFRWIKDQLTKLQYGAEMFTLFTVDEMNLILNKGRRMKEIKDVALENYKNNQKESRRKLIVENWESTLEEAEDKKDDNPFD